MQRESLRILVVDDENDVLEVICRFLQRLRYEPVAVDGGAKAIELLKTGHFDLAVVDTHMPDVDGNVVRRFIKENLPELAVITASAVPPGKADTESVPRRHLYLRKPFPLTDLGGAIEKLTQGCHSA